MTPGLDKSAMGEYIGRGPADQCPFISKVLEEYCNSFDFEGKITVTLPYYVYEFMSVYVLIYVHVEP